MHFYQNRKKFRKARAAVLIAAAIPALHIKAATRTWDTTVPAGLWSASTSWTLAQVPAADEEIHLNSTNSDPFAATFDLPSAPKYGDIFLQDSASGTGEFRMSLIDSAVTLSAGNLFVGNAGAGRIVQSAGNVTVAGALTLGAGSGLGTYELSDGMVNTTGMLNVAGGSFLQSGGVNTVGQDLNIDSYGVTSASYSLSGPAKLLVTGTEYVTANNASFTQTGGTNTTSQLRLDNSYSLQGGTLSAANIIVGDSAKGNLDLSNGATISNVRLITVGAAGTGTFNHNSGTITLAPLSGTNAALILGDSDFSKGTYNLRDGSLTVTGNEIIGSDGRGTFNQSGGLHTLAPNNAIILESGKYGRGRGNYNLSGGTLQANLTLFYLNSFNQTGGMLISDIINLEGGGASFTLGAGGTVQARLLAMDRDATFNMSGVMHLTDALSLSSFASGFNQLAGALTVDKYLYCGYQYQSATSGATSIYTLTSGSIHVKNQMYCGFLNAGNFTQNGGDVTADNGLFVATFRITFKGSEQSFYNLNAGTLTAPIIIGYSNGASGVFNQTSGVVNSSGVELGLTGTGTINLSGGTMNAGFLNFGRLGGTGLLNHSGGTLNVGTNSLAIGLTPNALATYNMSNGASLNVSTEMEVGWNGKGIFNQTGGTVRLNSTTYSLLVASGSNSTGTYKLSDGLINLNNSMYVGYGGAATFNQSGGTINAVHEISINQDTGTPPPSALNMTGGAINAEFLLLNNNSTFSQTNGAVTLTQALQLSLKPGALATYNMTGGSLDAKTAIIGDKGIGVMNLSSGIFTIAHDETIGLGGTGTFTQTGGTHVVGGALDIGPFNSSSASGTFALKGGTLTAASINVHPRGTFTHTAGSFATPALTVSGGTAVLGAGQQWPANAVLTATDGNVIFNADSGTPATANLALEISGDNTSVILNSMQHLRGANLAGGQTRLANGAALITPSLVVQNAARLDIGHGGIIVNYTAASPLDDIRAAIISGRSAGDTLWRGPGIASSDAILDPSLAIGYAESSALFGAPGGHFMGQDITGPAVLVRTTIAGDADLNGTVDFADLVAVAQHYGQEGTGSWITGDFDYDANVGFSDLVTVAQNYGRIFDTPQPAGASAEFGPDLAAAFAQVPEPSLPALVVVAAGWMIVPTRRRR